MVLTGWPDVRQRGGSDCGVAALKAGLRYWGLRASWAELSLGVGHSEMDGTDPRALEGYVRRAGLCALAGSMGLEELAHFARLGRPVICLVTRRGVGHYVTSLGTRRGMVVYHDPAQGVLRRQHGDFLGDWADWDRLGGLYKNYGLAYWR